MPEDERLYDTEILVQTHQADGEFIKYMISLFIKHAPETNDNLKKACDESDWEKVHFFAHKLKASIDLFNLKQLKELVRKVEQKAQKLTQTDTIANDVSFISNYIHKCVAAMKEEFMLD